MGLVTYVDHRGEEYKVSVAEGISLMRAAVDSNVPGIDGDCGGSAACATCRVYVDPDWLAVVGQPLPDELEMLAVVEDGRPDARLSCQIVATPSIDGLIVRLPETQR